MRNRSPAQVVTLGDRSTALAEHDDLVLHSVEWTQVDLPLRTDLHHAAARTSHLTSVLCRVTSGDQHGVAEVRTNAAYGTGEDTPDVSAATALPGPLHGRSLAAVRRTLATRSHLAGLVVDLAGWDLLGRRAGQPLAVMLRPAASRSVRTHGQIPFGGVDRAAALAADLVGRGLRRLKVRVGAPDAEHDLDRVRAVRRAAGDGVDISVDANRAWSAETAVSTARRLAELGVRWVEQPTASVADLAAVRHDGAVRVRADESFRGAADVPGLLGAVDGVHVKLEKSGSVASALAAAATARGAGLDVALGQFDQGRLGCAATLHVAAVLGLEHAELWGFADVVDDLAGPLELQGGALALPDAPGLGLLTRPDLEWSSHL